MSTDQVAKESKKTPPLFTSEERRTFVRSFVDAYLRGTVEISYWRGDADLRKLTTGERVPGTEKLEMKKTFGETLETACEIRTPKPSASEVENAIDLLFTMIVIFKQGDFLKGKFLGAPDTELKIQELHDRVSSIEKLFDELIQRTKIRDP
jgi:hypothetical protein